MINMNYSKIIIRPILSEKANKLSSIKRQYVFEVTKASNKLQIKAAVEKKFDVKEDPIFSNIKLIAKKAIEHGKIAGIHNGSTSNRV